MSVCKMRQNQLLVTAGMAGCTGKKALIPVWIGFCLIAFPNTFHLGNWYHFLMASVTLYYTKHSWTPASRQSRLSRIGTTKNIWVANKLLLSINGDVSICASGCKIPLLLRQSSEEPSLWLTHVILSPILGLRCVRESQAQQHINNSLPLTSGCLFVSPSGSHRSPHVSRANTGRRTGQEMLSRPLQGRCKPTVFLAVLPLAGLGLYPLHLRLFRLQGQGPPTVCMFLQSPEQDFHFCWFSLG